MRKLVSVLMVMALVLVSTTASAESLNERRVASKHNVTKAVNVGDFDKLCLNGNSDIVYTPTSGVRKLELFVPDNLQDIVEVYVKDRTLVLEFKKGYSVSFNNGAKLELRVSAPMVKSAVLNGSGDIVFRNMIDVNHAIDFVVNGSGDLVAGNVKCRQFNATLNGSGDIAVGHTSAENVNAVVNGSGDVVLTGVAAGNVSAAVNGSGDVTVKGISADSANGSVRGSGDVSLSGKCKSANYSLKGSGDISASSLKAEWVSVYTASNSSGDVSCYASESINIDKRGRSSDISYKGNPRTVEKNSTKNRGHHRHNND